MTNPVFEERYKIHFISSDIIDKYTSGILFEKFTEDRKRKLEIINKIVDENITVYEKIIFQLYYVDGLVMSEISKILKQNMKTVYRRIYKINEIIKILYPIYSLDKKELKKELSKRFTEDEILILNNLQKRYNIESIVRKTKISFDKVKKMRMLVNKFYNKNNTPVEIYLDAIRQLNNYRKNLRVY